MHWTDLDNLAILLSFQQAITATSCHVGDIQQFGTIDEAVVCAQSLAVVL